MTGPGGFRRPADDGGIRISMDRQVPVGAGQTVDIPVLIVHDGPAPTSITLSVLGLDPRWIPPPVTVDAVAAGETVELVLRIPVERGALAARYPFVVAAQTAAIAGSRPRIAVAESDLVVDAQERLLLTVRPQQPVAVFRRRFDVTVTNPGHEPRTVSLRAQTAAGAGIVLDKTQIDVPAGRTASVRGRLSVRRPRMFGSENTYPFSVTGRGTGASQTADGVFRSRPLIRGWLSGLIAVATVLALWATLGLIVLPRLSDRFAGVDASTAAQAQIEQSRQSAAAQSAADAAATSAAASSAAASAATGGAGAGAGSGGGGAAPASDGGTAGGTGTGGNSRLAGSVDSGTDPGGTVVIVQPTTVVQAQQQDAQAVDGLVAPSTAQALRDSTAVGKVWGSALRTTAPGDEPVAPISTTTAEDGTWSFAGLSGPGFYLLTVARAGFQTQRFVVDSALLGSADPMKVTLVPGQGSMSGTVTSPTGPVGSATVAITDGTTTLTTSTVSTGSEQGSWKVDGLATPGDYLITVTAAGYGTESALSSLAAGASAVTDLQLQAGVASITGQVSGQDQFGNVGGLGGLTVTAVFGDVTRTATTITSGAIGRFALPDLPTPGDYTLTVTGPGYQSQTQQVALGAGAGNAEVPISMTRADGVVAGTVFDETGAGLAGAGLTLTGADDSFKTMAASSPAGAYRFTGVLPGLYVLSATMYGRQTAFATVQITAAETVTTDLTLPLSTSGEVPADSRIRGRAVDNRSAGPLNCDRAAAPVSDCRATVTTVMTALDGTQQTITTITTPAGDYTLPALDDTDHPGLLPGLYALTFDAPGFEPQQITVQVGQSQIVAAPQVSMLPLGMIAGQVTAVVGTPGAPTCILAGASTATLPDTCTVVPPDPADPAATATCTAGTDVRCTLTDASGNYELRGFRSGGYLARAVPTDPEYLPTDVAPLQLAVSEVKQFAPVLNRKGRLVVTVMAPDELTGSLALANGVTVDIAAYDPNQPVPPDFPPVLATKTTGSDSQVDNQAGTVMFTGLPDGRYDIRVSGGQRNLFGRAQSAPVAINQETPTQVIGAPTYPAVVGRVLTVVDGVAQPLANATVRVSGTVTVVTSNGLLPGTATLTTDANGCYAILSTDNAAAVPTSPECPAGVSSPASGLMGFSLFGGIITIPANLAVRTVDVTVTDAAIPPRTQPFQAVGAVAAPPVAPETSYTLATFTILAQPVPLGSWFVRTDFAQPGLAGTGASVAVTRKPAAAGNVTVALAGDGSLSVTDDLLSTPNVLTPGLYQLHAVALGYLPADADLWCGLGQACRLLPFGTVDPASPPTATQPPSDPNALTLHRVGLMAGRITLPAGGPLTPLAFTAVQVLRTPSGAGAITVRVAADGTVTFADARFAGLGPTGLATPGEYEFILTLSGYNPTTLRVACDSGDATRGGRCYQITDQQTGPSQQCIADPTQCNALSVTLASLPSFAATVVPNTSTLPDGSAVNLTQVSIAVTQQAVASSVITVTVNADGTVNWRDQSLDPVAQLANTIQAGSYTITASLPGFQSTQASYSFNCTSGTCGPAQITLRSLPRPSVDVKAAPVADGLDFPAALISITARPSGTGGLSGTAIPVPGVPERATIVWSDSALPYAGIVSPGDYQFRINLAGYQQSGLLTLSCPASNAQSACTLSGPDVDAGIVTLARFPLLANGTWSVAPADSSVQPTIQVTAAPSGAGPITVTANADGTLSWSEAGLPPNLVRPGPYQLAISANGYDTRSYPFTCDQGTTCTPTDLALSKSGQLKLTMISARGVNVPANGATVTLSGTNIPSNTVTLASTVNTVSFANISAVDPAAFTVRVQAGGFAFTTVTATSPATTVTCSGSVGNDLPGLRVQPGDTDCTIKLVQRGQLAGTTLGVSSGAGGPVTDELSQVLITAQRTAPVADPALAPVRSNPDGTYLLTGTNVVDGMLDGTWSVTATRTGYLNATGTVTIAGGLITAATGDLQLDQAAQTVAIRLAVQPVNLRVQVKFGTTDVTSGVQLALSDSSFTRIAFCDSAQATSVKCTLPVAPTTYFEFTSINPAVYNLVVTSSTYRGLTTTVPIVAGQAVQSIVINLSSGSSTVTGSAISASTGSPVVGATVDLVTEASPDTPAPSTNPGVLLTTTTRAAAPGVTAGSYELANVPDKRYQVRITAAGYETWRSPFFDAQAALNPNIAVQQATVVRSSRTVTVTLVSSAAGAPPFNGASISLTPTPGTGPDFPATPLAGTVGAGNIATISNVPTGTYTVTALTLPGARPFSAGLYTTSLVVGAQPPPSPPPVAVDLPIDETAVTFSASLAGGSCVTAVPPSLTASVTRTSPAQTQQVSMPVSGTTATSGVTYLPNTAFSWSVVTTGAASFWTSPTQNFTTAGAALSQAIALQPSRVPVPATMTLNNDPADAVSLQPVAAPGSGVTAPASTLTNGTATMCLTPGVQWTIAPTGPTVYVGASQQLTPTVATPGSYTYVGQALAPTAALQAVPGRTGDARTVTLALFTGSTTTGTPLYSVALAMTAGATTATPPNTIYAPGGQYTWTATPPATDVYAVGQAPVNLPGNGTAALATTVTMNYNRVVATISATRGGVPQAGTTITITVGTVTRTAPTAGAAGNVTLYDVPAGSWTVTAQYIDTTTNPDTTYRGTLTPAVSPTAAPTAQTFGPIVLSAVP